MATNKISLKNILTLLRKKIRKEDLEWFQKENPDRYNKYEKWVGNKEEISNTIKHGELVLSIEYLITAITRNNVGSYLSGDIPKCYIIKLAEILNTPIPKKFKKRDLISSILEINKNKNAV